jgi:hypothetical protein
MKNYFKIYYQYQETGKRILCRIFYGTHPTKSKEYKLCKNNFEEGYIYAYGYDKCTPQEIHDIKINKLLYDVKIPFIELLIY